MSKKTLTGLADTLGTARLIGNFENGSQEWHELRATGIGGSDIAAICNASPWTSPFALWAKKTGRIEDDITDSEPAEWGNRLEEAVIDKFASTHPELTVHRKVGTWRHIIRTWQLANPDALYENEDGTFGIFECKTAQFEDEWTLPPKGVMGTADGVPAWYRTQVQWYLDTFGFQEAIVGALFHGNKYREFLIAADTFEQATNLDQVLKFREYLDTDTQPDYDGALSTLETIREMHPNITDDEVELGDLGMYYELARIEFGNAEKHFTEMKSRVLDAMGNAKRGLINDVWTVTRQARAGGKPFLVQKKG